MPELDPTIGFIGIGVLGKGLAMSLAARQYQVVAAHSRSLSSAQWLAHRLPGCQAFASAQELADAADLVFITTPDSAIGQVAATVRWRPDQGVVHCCGAASLEVLQPAAAQGAVTGAFHPFQTFAGLADPGDTLSRLAGVTFAVEGQGWLSGFLGDLARTLGGHPVFIPHHQRPLYHAAAVLGCGYLVTLLQAAVTAWQAMGFSPKRAMDALYPLARATLENVAQRGITASVTGPVVRGDAATVQAHLEALHQSLPDLVPLYCALTDASLPLAASRGISPDYLAALEELLEGYRPASTHSPKPGLPEGVFPESDTRHGGS
jgi:predicted short-subunit dehydrogenase-like oxidoreductase (DUF2520 family)